MISPSRILWLTFASLLLPCSAISQVDRSALNGAVKDAAGRLIPEVHLTATENNTGFVRVAVTSRNGTFDIPELPIGTYTLRLEHAGFASLVYTGVLQTVGQTRTLNATLQVAGSAEQIQVTDNATEINQNSATLGARVEPQQITQLPLNGRNWSTLTALVPGAVDTGGSNQRSIRFAGRGLDDNNFTYDGVDATNIVNQAQQPFVRLAIPTASIEEFRVNTALFTAEQGSTPGGQVAVVSRAGGNEFHGTLFEFLRNDKLDAREPIDTLNPTKPPFRLNQFGGSLGGPIQRDRTFFFTTYEGLRQTLGQTLPGFVPTAALRAQVLATSPQLAPIINAYPNPTIANPGTGPNYVSEGRQRDHEDSGMVRIDHRFSPKDTADFRFNFDAALSQLPLAGAGTFTTDKQQVASRPVNGVIESLHLFSDHLVNEAKFGFNRGNVYTTNVSTLNLPFAVAISGLTTLNNDVYKVGVGNSFSEIDNLTWLHGAHTLKFGAEVRRIQLNQGNTASGTVSFAAGPSSNPFANLISDTVSSASYAAQLPVNGLRKTSIFSYVQDEWKFRPELTFNLGVRYSFFNLFHEVAGKAIPFDFPTCGAGGFCGAGASFGQPNYGDIDPRLSVAWAPTHLHSKTVLRAGFGLYHGDGQLDDQNLPINNEVARYSLQGVSFPVTPYLANTNGIVSPRDNDRLRKDAYVTEWGTSVQQDFGKGWVGTGSYVGSQGTYLLRTSYTNLKDPVTGVRQFPAFGQVETRGNHNSSSYQALAMTVRRAFSQGLLFQANYVYSHEIDQDAAGGGDSDFPENPACFSCERASGDFDVRHVFSGDLVYHLPYGHGQSFGNHAGIAPVLFGDWQVSSIVSARTGLPVNVTVDRSSSSVATGYTTNQRPNRVPGVSLVPMAGTAIHNWINPAAFSTTFVNGAYGNAGRNLVRAPNLWQADMALARNVPLRESLDLQFRAEFFNVFNRAQYGSPLADVTGAGFGSIVTEANTGPVGTGTPRQIQFLLELRF